MDFYEKPHTVLSGKSLLNANRPGVYGWLRGDKYLYIGQSVRVLNRLGSHNIIGTPANPILPDDKIVVWYFKTQQEAVFKEMEMIMEYLPPLNYAKLKDKMSEAKCLYCGNMYKQVRHWQKFCSKKCQTSNVRDYPEDIQELELDEEPLRPLEGYRTITSFVPRYEDNSETAHIQRELHKERSLRHKKF